MKIRPVKNFSSVEFLTIPRIHKNSQQFTRILNNSQEFLTIQNSESSIQEEFTINNSQQNSDSECKIHREFKIHDCQIATPPDCLSWTALSSVPVF